MSYGASTVPLVTTLHYFGPVRAEQLAAEFDQRLETTGRILERLQTLRYVERVEAADGFGWAWDSTRRWLPEEDRTDGDEGE